MRRTTPLGKELRKMRLDLDMTLRDMASSIGVSAAFLSSVELGRKKPPKNFVDSICTKFNLTDAEKNVLRIAEGESRTEFVIRPKTNGALRVALALSGREDLGEVESEKILRILEGAKK